MPSFQFEDLAGLPNGYIVSACLGTAAAKFADADIGKPVKLATSTPAENYILCADGDEIEGFVVALDGGTVNDGFAFGSVRKREYQYVKNSGAAAIAVGATVVAAAPSALGTAETNGLAKVKAGSPTKFIWRVLSLCGGVGAVGSKILIERV